MSGMRLSKIGYDDGKTRHYTFEPLGYGCSQDCMAPRKCWAARQAARQRKNCSDCADFKVHFHPERLEQPAKTEKPGVVLTAFHADWCDPCRAAHDADAISQAMREADWHNYVTLTKQPRYLGQLWKLDLLDCSSNHYHGLTIRTQAEADEKLPIFMAIHGNLWLSLEPLWGNIQLRDFSTMGPPGIRALAGIIVGQDNKWGAPGTDTLDHIRSIVQQCEAASVKCYVKQIWHPDYNYMTHQHSWRLLRASHPDEFALYPEDLKLRNLPWTMPEASQ